MMQKAIGNKISNDIKSKINDGLKFKDILIISNDIKRYDNYFKISPKGKSAVDEIEDLLYTTAYCTESVSISTIPVYYLEPNNRIYIEDKRSGVEGEYLVNKITMPLTYNGLMSISATKAISRVY